MPESPPPQKPHDEALLESQARIAEAIEAVLELNAAEWDAFVELTPQSHRALAAVARLSPAELRSTRTLLDMRVVRGLLSARTSTFNREIDEAWQSSWDALVKQFDALIARLPPRPKPGQP